MGEEVYETTLMENSWVWRCRLIIPATAGSINRRTEV
jgi:hypothetical protein